MNKHIISFLSTLAKYTIILCCTLHDPVLSGTQLEIAGHVSIKE